MCHNILTFYEPSSCSSSHSTLVRLPYFEAPWFGFGSREDELQAAQGYSSVQHPYCQVQWLMTEADYQNQNIWLLQQATMKNIAETRDGVQLDSRVAPEVT